MSKNIRIRTTPNGGDKNVKIQLNQDFDFLEILSLKISQEDAYRSFYSNYGVVVGRVIMNSGVGVPNAKVSIFIPLDEEDAQDPEISTIYPYSDIQVLNNDGVRYNTLPKNVDKECHAPIGTFPLKREIIDNDKLFKVYKKYYKYTTTTNDAGDFMLFGVPVGNHILNVDVDLSDIGIFSQRPYDFIEQGNPEKLFESPTKFKTNNNLNNLTQVKNRQVGVNVIPFWGDKVNNEVGISRVDVDLNYNVEPKAIFIGSIFSDNDKNSVNKNCRARKKLGKVCEMGEGKGTINIIRKNRLGDTEKFNLEGGQLINDDGVWAFQLPMNLDYKVTDEFGDLIPTDNPNIGIPTRTNVRFKIGMNETGGEGRIRTRAKYLVPHNPNLPSEIDYSFDESTSDIHFRDMFWNKIYTVKNHITRFQRNPRKENRNFIGFKDVDDCVGTKNPLPFNKLDTDFNPLFIVLCLIVNFIITIVDTINKVVTVKLLFTRPFCGFGCVKLKCPINETEYAPGCRHDCERGGANGSTSQARKCFSLALAESLNVFEFDFYNDWINGSLYPFLLKYKKVSSNEEKFCGSETGDYNIVDTYFEGGSGDDSSDSNLSEGVAVSYEGELFYKPITDKKLNFYNTDIYELGSVLDCDWQGKVKIQGDLVNSSYKRPPLIGEGETTGSDPLFFDIDCSGVDINRDQYNNIRRICEIGLGLDEGDSQDGLINRQDIDDKLIRSKLIKLNVDGYESSRLTDINSNFNGSEYGGYRGQFSEDGMAQYQNSFFFYFGTKPNSTAIDLMNSKYFTECTTEVENIINISGVVTEVTTVGGSDGTISINVNGGTQPYTYKWYDSNESNSLLSDNKDINGLASGSYFVVVEDDNGVTTKKTFVVRGLREVNGEVSTRNTESASSNNGIIYVSSLTGGIPPYTVQISGPSQATKNNVQFSTSFTGLDEGNYTVTITDSNTPSDSVSYEATVEVPTPLSVTVDAEDSYCVGFNSGVITINIAGGTPFYDVVFRDISDPNNPFVFNRNVNYSDNATAQISYNNLQAGSYDFYVVDDLNQRFPSAENTQEEIIITETSRPTLTRSGGDLEAGNLKVDNEYTLEDGDGNVLETFTANNTTETLTGYSEGNGPYQITSEGCSSDFIE